MTTRVTVLGAGPGGYVAAVRAAQLGAAVTVVEKEQVGGTCLNRGCIPSKIMKTTADMLEKFHQAETFGIRTAGGAVPDIPRLMARKQSVLAAQIKGIEGLLAHHKVTLIRGDARIAGPGRASAVGVDGQAHDWEWDRLIIATGSRPLSVPAFPFDGRRILSSDHILNIETVPESMVIVGGGVIGCEFACILSAMGTEVILVEALDRLLPLPSVDAGCSKVLEREMKKRRIKFHLNRVVESMVPTADGLRVTIGPSPFAAALKDKDKVPVTAGVQQALVCIGRSPNTDGIGLSTIGVEADAKGWIPVDERLQTRVPGVYAIGDVLGPQKVMLAHVASTEGMLAAENAMGSDRLMDYTAVPGAIFTMPEVACVGLTAVQAQEQGIDARADTVLFRAIGKAQVIGELAGQATIVSEAGSGKVLGVHMIGPHATDLMGEGTLAVANHLGIAEIAGTVHAHPTLGEIMLEAALKAAGRALHG
jgi:dihydrolipoamide dehydrogenase